MTREPRGSVNPIVDRDATVNKKLFPSMVPAVSLAINDIGYDQKLLSTKENFAEQTSCEIIELSLFGTHKLLKCTSDDEFEQYMQTDIADREGRPMTRIIFISLAPEQQATFGCQTSVSMAVAHNMLQRYLVRPEFTSLLLGQFAGNHLAPAEFDRYNDTAEKPAALDFICQQPRWGFRDRKWPVSSWMSFDVNNGVSTIIISHGTNDERIIAVKRRLAAGVSDSAGSSLTMDHAHDPFLVQTMLCHECFMQSDGSIFNLGKRLYDAIDSVDNVAESSLDGTDLKTTTFKFHQVSQDADSLIQSADIAISIVEAIRAAQDRLTTWLPHLSPAFQYELQRSISAVEYLRKGIAARKRWLLGAKSRKDTTMNLVYNLVSQREADTSLAIARDTKNDSSSMKAIAALTMVFLPATAVTSFFGMSFFNGAGGKLVVSSDWWVFVAVSLPLTVATLVVWWLWDNFAIQRASSEGSPNRFTRCRGFLHYLKTPRQGHEARRRLMKEDV